MVDLRAFCLDDALKLLEGSAEQLMADDEQL
jgi:hypothetical protein